MLPFIPMNIKQGKLTWNGLKSHFGVVLIIYREQKQKTSYTSCLFVRHALTNVDNFYLLESRGQDCALYYSTKKIDVIF